MVGDRLAQVGIIYWSEARRAHPLPSQSRQPCHRAKLLWTTISGDLVVGLLTDRENLISCPSNQPPECVAVVVNQTCHFRTWCNGEIMTVVIVAMRAMLTRRPSADGTEDGRRCYEKFFEARTIPGLVPGRVGAHRGEFHTLAKIPMHSHGDKMALVCLHLRHVEDCTAAEAREKHYDALGGEACARFLRRKEQQEYDAHRREGEGAKSGPPAYKFLAIYEIVSIRRVAGGVRTTQPHTSPAGAGAAPKQRHRGTAAAQGSGSSSSSGEDEEEEWAP